MKLIKKLDRRKNKTGNQSNRWALFYCKYCNKEVERRCELGLKQKSCGCMHYKLMTESKTIHGESGIGKRTKIYSIWSNMRQRCNNKKHKNYKNYGGRGIIICNEWKEYIPFKEWAIFNGYKKGLTIDRRNNNGNYESNNCRWVTSTVNNQNTRATKLNWKKVRKIREMYATENCTHAEIADIYNINRRHVGDIINHKVWKE